MSSLTSALQLRTSLVWITSEEPGRILDHVITVESMSKEPRPVYRVDAIEGLLVYNFIKRTWLGVLVDDSEAPAGVSVPPDLGKALPFIYNSGGVLMIENAHVWTEQLLNFFTSIHYKYRDALFEDNAEKMPPQFLMQSHKPDAPPELARLAALVTTELPEPEELEMLTKMMYRGRTEPEEHAVAQIVRAAKGMDEGEFLSAAMQSLRDNDKIDEELINRIKLDSFKESGVLEVTTPDSGLDNLGGLDNLKELISRVSWIWHNPEEANQFGIEALRRMLLIGVPGTGKSLAAKCIAASLGLDLAKGGTSNAMSKWVGESEANMRKMFKLLNAMAPIVFWIDEFGRDMSGSQSSGSTDSGTTDRVHGEFLTGLQELAQNIFLVAAANRIDDLPPEMTRAERFDVITFVGFPTHDERKDIFKIHLPNKGEGFDLDALAETTPQFTGAEIAALIKQTNFKVGAGERRKFTTADLLIDIPNVRGRVWVNHRPAIVAMYERALREWEWASSSQQEEAPQVLALAKPQAKGNSMAGDTKIKAW